MARFNHPLPRAEMDAAGRPVAAGSAFPLDAGSRYIQDGFQYLACLQQGPGGYWGWGFDFFLQKTGPPDTLISWLLFQKE
jgi:hypothetical protein